MRRGWLLLVVLAPLACGDRDGERSIQAPPVAVTQVQLRDLTERIEATGQLIARNRARIGAEVSGRVTEVVVDEGGAAEVGTVILKIDPERRELELASARAKLAEARAGRLEQQRETARVRTLRQQNVAAKASLEQAETQLELARSRVDAAQAGLGVAERTLAHANVTAPFAGSIAERFVSAGEYVQVGQQLVELVALDPLEVEFHVTEVDSSRVRLGQVVGVRVAPWPDEVFEATVSLVSPTIDPRTRTLRVKALVDNPSGRLRPGLFARADLGVSQRIAVPMIPEESILQRSDGAVVFLIAEGNRVERRVIEMGTFRDGLVEVVRGVAPGDQVVWRGQTELVDGAVVAIRNPDGSALPARDIASRPGEPDRGRP